MLNSNIGFLLNCVTCLNIFYFNHYHLLKSINLIISKIARFYRTNSNFDNFCHYKKKMNNYWLLAFVKLKIPFLKKKLFEIKIYHLLSGIFSTKFKFIVSLFDYPFQIIFQFINTFSSYFLDLTKTNLLMFKICKLDSF